MALTAERLRQLFSYDAESGVFSRFVGQGPTKAGPISGFLRSNGYLMMCVDRRQYRVHRLAFLYMTGAWPDADIDHIDGNRANNRWMNLRQATRQQNLANKRLEPGRNKSGYKGVSWCAKKRLWASYIKKDRKSRFLGYFRDREPAHEAYKRAATDLFGDFARFV